MHAARSLLHSDIDALILAVLQVDDLIATGGTLRAGINLMGAVAAAEALQLGSATA